MVLPENKNSASESSGSATGTFLTIAFRVWVTRLSEDCVLPDVPCAPVSLPC
jgi:hypothetical protein